MISHIDYYFTPSPSPPGVSSFMPYPLKFSWIWISYLMSVWVFCVAISSIRPALRAVSIPILSL